MAGAWLQPILIDSTTHLEWLLFFPSTSLVMGEKSTDRKGKKGKEEEDGGWWDWWYYEKQKRTKHLELSLHSCDQCNHK